MDSYLNARISLRVGLSLKRKLQQKGQIDSVTRILYFVALSL
jgi:hypothetical protein